MITFDMTLLEICAQNQGNSVSGDLKCKNFPGPPKADHLRRSIITIQGAKCITVTQDTSPSGVDF